MLCQCTLILKNVALIKYVLQSYRASHWTTSLLPVPIINLLPVPIINLLPVPIINLLPVPVNRHYVILCSTAGGDVMLDINASTGGVIDRGNDLDGKKMSYAFYSGYFVGLGVSLRPGCTTSIGCTSSSIYPVPNAFLTLNGVQDVRDFHQEAFETGDGGFRDNQLMEKMVSARFFVPDLPPGDYLIQINVSLGVTTGIGSFDDDQGWFTDTEVVLGPHIIVAQVLQATNRVCDPSMYLESMGM
jgi:hypothetical protein